MKDTLGGEAITRLLNDLARAELGDPRRVARAQSVMSRLAVAPKASLPDAMVTDAELEGAYRLFNNDEVTFEELFDAHALGTAERAHGKRVLAIHDTTTCAFSHLDPAEVGYLNTGKPGFLLHMTLLVDTGDWRRPLGLTHAEVLMRQHKPRTRRSKHRMTGGETKKLVDREFERWRRGVEITERRLANTGTSVLHIADRETDSYELMATCIASNLRFVFRAKNTRTVDQGGESVRIRDFLVDEARVMLERNVPLSRRLGKTAPVSRRAHPPRESRTAKLRFSATQVDVRRPNIVPARFPKTLTINALHVFEVDTPSGQDPVDWILYTTEPIETAEQIAQVVDAYRCRWLIEELNKALKTGCVVQKRQLESYEAITTLLAISLPIAVELLALRALARSSPEAPADLLLSAQQLAALRHMSHRPLPRHPTAQEVLWCIAGLGGHIKNNGAPGWQVLQRGMEKYLPFAAGWCAHADL